MKMRTQKEIENEVGKLMIRFSKKLKKMNQNYERGKDTRKDLSETSKDLGRFSALLWVLGESSKEMKEMENTDLEKAIKDLHSLFLKNKMGRIFPMKRPTNKPVIL